MLKLKTKVYVTITLSGAASVLQKHCGTVTQAANLQSLIVRVHNPEVKSVKRDLVCKQLKQLAVQQLCQSNNENKWNEEVGGFDSVKLFL